MRRLLLSLFLVCSFFVEGMSRPASVSSPALGVKTLSYEDSDRGRPIVIELWYPTAERGGTAKNSVWVHPKELRDASLLSSKGPLPLIIMSHGLGGDRRERSWLADVLARRGFLVASLDHYGNTWKTFDSIESLKYWERILDVSFALDRLLEEPFLEGKIDTGRIGFSGYSLAGLTGLGLAGCVAHEPEKVVEAVRERYPELTPEKVSQVDFSLCKQSLRDERIGAFLLIAPATHFYDAESFKAVKSPVALVAAIYDDVLPHVEHSFRLIRDLVPAKLKIFRQKITHYAFLNRVSKAGKKVLNSKIQRDSAFYTRTVVHREVGDFAVDFFNEFLK